MAATWTVWPTENNVHHTAGEADATNWTETMQRKLWDPESEDVDSIPLAERNPIWVKDDGDFTNNASGLNVDIDGGVLVAGGYVITQVGAQTVALAANDTNYVWLTLPMSGGLVSADPVYSVNQNIATIPLRGVLLYIVNTNGSAVTGTVDRRPIDHPWWIKGTYTGVADATNVTVACGFNPSRVYVTSTSGGEGPGWREKGISQTWNRLQGPTTTPRFHINLAGYGFFIQGKSTPNSNSDLAANGVGYDFKAWR